MRHGKRVNHLSRQTQHRKLMLGNMACSLIMHKRIKTTLAKAKALRRFVEPLITRGKENSTHNRRMCFKYLQQKEAVTELFTNVAAKVADRPGGYLRIVRIGTRYGDNAEMCIIELVDYNEIYTTDKKAKATGTKKRRSRRGGGNKAATAATGVAAATDTVVETVKDAAETVTDAVKETAADTAETVTDVVEKVVETTEEATKKATEAVKDVTDAAADKLKGDTAAEDEKAKEE